MFKIPERFPRTTPQSDSTDGLDAFGSEHSPPSRRPSSSSTKAANRDLRIPLGVTFLVGIIALCGYLVGKWRPVDVEASSASMTIESDPAGAEVFAAGVKKGRTPVTLTIAPGDHVFELVHEGRRKSLRTAARAGAAVVHHVQFEPHPPPPPTKGILFVETEPRGLRVFVNGRLRGAAPVMTSGLEPGGHRVEVLANGVMLERKVEVRAGETSTVLISAGRAVPPPPMRSTASGPSGPAAGWLIVESPVALQIFEGKDLIGTSQSSRILVPAGRHELLLANEMLGFSERRTVQIKTGATSTIRADIPNAPLNINALPWAEVWVDGKRVGETPIGNYRVSVGNHEVVFRHPELGERRHIVTVSARGTTRVAVDLRKPQQ
jgi:hypothetical protein